MHVRFWIRRDFTDYAEQQARSHLCVDTGVDDLEAGGDFLCPLVSERARDSGEPNPPWLDSGESVPIAPQNSRLGKCLATDKSLQKGGICLFYHRRPKEDGCRHSPTVFSLFALIQSIESSK